MADSSIMMKEDATDWTSQLPKFIVHHILSLLCSPKELVQMSVLSKTWFALTASFPILVFDIEKLYDVIDKSGTPFELKLHTNACFFKYVEYTTSRFCHQNVTNAHTLNLITEILEDDTQVDSVDSCLESVLRKGVKELKIDIDPPYEKPFPNHCLPNVLLSASSLTSLKISRCDLPPALMVDVVKFNSLKFLQIMSVTINEKELKRLTAGCPLLEELDVTNCKGFKRFCVYGRQNLQKVRLFFVEKVKKIDIQAPNLWYLDVWDLEKKVAPCHSHNPGALVRNAYPSKARLECYPDEAADTIWFQKFKRFLDKKNQRVEVASAFQNGMGFIGVEELKVNQSPPLKLEHVELDMTIVQELVVYLSVMDAIFWCCCPQYLTLTLKSIWDTDFEDWSQIVKFTYEKLFEQEDQGSAIIQLALSSSSKAKEQFSDLNSLLKALPHNGSRQTIIFIKEEVVQEAS